MGEGEGHDHCPACRAAPGDDARLTRRQLLRLGVTGTAIAAAAPLLRHDPATSFDLGATRLAVAPRPDWPVPPIVTRSQWGADEGRRKDGQVYDGTIEKLIVHHTATPNDPDDPAAIMRGIYDYSLANDYIDVPYHFVIDQHGRIYEGRWARDYPAGAPHTGEAKGKNVRGGHALAHNSRTIGIALMGNYVSRVPSKATIESLVKVLAWKCARWGLDPLGKSPYVNGNGETVTPPNICGHRDTKPTLCPGDLMWNLLPDVRARVDRRLKSGTSGYWVAGRDGTALAFGDVPDHGDLRRLGVSARIRGMAGHPNGRGYWLLGTDGGVFTFGEARFFGSTGGLRLNRPVVGMSATRTGAGYWLVADDGGVFTFGDARFFGSTGAVRLNRPIIGMCRTPRGAGYWLFASDGGIFSFGDARFFGSTGGISLNRPIVAMAATPSGGGYWLVAEDGGVFTFGDARFFGSGVSRGLRSPVIDVEASSTGKGYSLLCRDGTVAAFGDAPYYGSATGRIGEAAGFAGNLVPVS